MTFECFDSWPVSTGTSCRSQTTSTAMPTTSSASAKEWLPVEGGDDRACRGSSPHDISESYYSVQKALSLQVCQNMCEAMTTCVGVEYSGRRCELWTRADGVQSSKSLPGFTCLSYAEPTEPIPLRSGEFEPVDGAWDRVCRGSSPSDNSARYFTVLIALPTLQDCQRKCREASNCTGVEYHRLGRCEIWTRSAGIEASAQVNDYSCWRFVEKLNN